MQANCTDINNYTPFIKVLASWLMECVYVRFVELLLVLAAVQTLRVVPVVQLLHQVWVDPAQGLHHFEGTAPLLRRAPAAVRLQGLLYILFDLGCVWRTFSLVKEAIDSDFDLTPIFQDLIEVNIVEVIRIGREVGGRRRGQR